MLDIKSTALVVVDVQGKLAQLMADKEALFTNLQRMVKGAKVLDLPVLWVEQNPDKLGPTIPEIATLMDGLAPISKMTFSCAGSDEFNRALAETGCHQILVVGIEAHICVCQTSVDLVAAGYHVELVTDAVSSRLESNKVVGLRRMESNGVLLTSTETALFEMMKTAEHPSFRDIQAIVK